MSIALDYETLDLFSPMYIILDEDGVVTRIGPTIAKLRDPASLIGEKLTDIFEVQDHAMYSEDGQRNLGDKLYLRFKQGIPTQMKGVAVKSGSGHFISLAFGVSVVDAVQEYRLTASDFPHFSMALELLYLVEAKSVIFKATQELNARLHGAKANAEKLALTDTLTGLKNRRAMDIELARMVGTGQRFALMHVDLDFFKSVNDTFGHAAGDAMLNHVSAVLSRSARKGDVMSRVGGDEFVAIIEGDLSEENLLAIASRWIAEIEEPVRFNGNNCKISASIGITRSQYYNTMDAALILHDADVASYHAKTSGRGRAKMFEPEPRGHKLAGFGVEY